MEIHFVVFALRRQINKQNVWPIKIIKLKKCNPSCPLYKRKEKDTVGEQLSKFEAGWCYFHVFTNWLVLSIKFMSPSTDWWVVAITCVTFEKAGFHCIQIYSRPTGIHTSSNSAVANKTGTFEHSMQKVQNRMFSTVDYVGTNQKCIWTVT